MFLDSNQVDLDQGLLSDGNSGIEHKTGPFAQRSYAFLNTLAQGSWWSLKTLRHDVLEIRKAI